MNVKRDSQSNHLFIKLISTTIILTTAQCQYILKLLGNFNIYTMFFSPTNVQGTNI